MPHTQTGRPGQTTQQVADYFGVAPKTVRRWREEGLIDGHKVGREFRYADGEVMRFARIRYGSLAAV
jgi:excisionase family DNA binding protein